MTRACIGLLVVALLAGCAHPIGVARRALREPGETLRDLPERVEQELGCAGRARPYALLETNEVNPPRVRPGGAFNHRIVYALCPSTPTATVEGTLTTRIRFKGRVLVDDRIDGYELKPGRWVVDSSVALPPTAEPGVYALEWRFAGAGIEEGGSVTFAVQ